MKIGSSTSTYSSANEVPLQSFRARYASGIDWTCVGGKWHAYDKGVACSKRSSTVTLSLRDQDMASNILTVLDALKNGSLLNVFCEDWEPIFGPEIAHVNTSPFLCLVKDMDSTGYTTGPLNHKIPTELTIEICPLTTYSLHTLPSYPTDVHIQNINHVRGLKYIPHDMEETYALTGMNFDESTAEVHFTATRDKVARAKTYFQEKRTNSFTFSTQNDCYLFTIGQTNENVVCLSVEDDGPEDRACINSSFTVVFGRG